MIATEIVRIGDTVIITPLDGPTALRLRTELGSPEGAYPELETKLVKIAD
jgi:virulence-associated protein VagC